MSQGVSEQLLGRALMVVGAVLGLVSIFLPRADAGTFSGIEQNTILQASALDGALIAIGALLTAVAALRSQERGAAGGMAILLGLAGLAYALFVGLDRGANLRYCAVLEPSVCTTEKPGLGIYALGLAGLLAAAGGFGLRRDSLGYDWADQEATHKQCPDCAEEVLAAARVCRFCGHEFAEAPPVSPPA